MITERGSEWNTLEEQPHMNIKEMTGKKVRRSTLHALHKELFLTFSGLIALLKFRQKSNRCGPIISYVMIIAIFLGILRKVGRGIPSSMSF